MQLSFFMKVYHCFNVYCFSGVLCCTVTVILFIALFLLGFFCHCVYACVVMIYICHNVQLLLSCTLSCPLSMCRSMCHRSNVLYVTKYLCPYPVQGRSKVHVRSSFHLKDICFQISYIYLYTCSNAQLQCKKYNTCCVLCIVA